MFVYQRVNSSVEAFRSCYFHQRPLAFIGLWGSADSMKILHWPFHESKWGMSYPIHHWNCSHISDWWFGTRTDSDFPYIGNVIIPTDEVRFFRGVDIYHQPDIAGYIH